MLIWYGKNLSKENEICIDTQKIIWTRKQSEVFDKYVEKYASSNKKDIYLLYWLKIKLFWLPFAYHNKADYINSLRETKDLIQEAEKNRRKNVRKSIDNF